MQIHELNNFTGTLGAGAYLAVDDGNDTGKLSTQQLLAATEARIDNIIAGPAPSAQEVTDARLGADGVTYSSLGNAIRSQVSDLKSDLSDLNQQVLATITNSTGDSTKKARAFLVKDRKYKYTNNTASAVNCKLYKADGTSTTLTNWIDAGASYEFICDSNDYVEIGSYFGASGNCVLESIDYGVYNLIDDINTFILNNEQILQEADDILYSENLFDVTQIEESCYFRYQNGQKVSSEYFDESGFIRCKEQTKYTATHASGGVQVVYYDERKDYLSGELLDSTYSFTTPLGAKFFRINVSKDTEASYAINEGNSATYTPYLVQVRIADKSISPECTTFISEKIVSKNLFNKSTAVNGFVNYTNGGITANDSFRSSDYIEVLPSTSYAISEGAGGIQTAFYDASKQFISGVLNNADVLTFTTPATAKYLRTCCVTEALNRFAVCKGTTATYSEYEEKMLIDEDLIPPRSGFLVVDKGGKGDYTTLTSAVNNAESGDTIYVKAGVYDNEEVTAWGKTLTIIGEGAERTIIKNGLNTYSRPPIEMSSGLLKDIQFYAYDGGEPSLDANGWNAYALHAESNDLYNNSFEAVNCIFHTALGVGGVGMGMRGGCHVRFVNCLFIADQDVAFYIHDAASDAYAGEQNLEMIACELRAFNASHAIRIASEKMAGSTIKCAFINNAMADQDSTPSAYMYNEGSGTATEVGNMGIINWNKIKTSRGNSIGALNY